MFSYINGITLCAILLLSILLLILYCDIHPCSVCRSYSFTFYAYSILLQDYATVYPFFCSWTFNLYPSPLFFLPFPVLLGTSLYISLCVYFSSGGAESLF